ncbi:MAG: gamma subclass chorismate mutase AroQ [Porticoccaceae bacterium]|nr:gamma subclass chorismate mutase AroQ [Porticoccaceae bacterium]
MASESELARLLDLVNERLQLMKDIAAYKFVNNVDIENTQREEIVLKRVLVGAQENQLNPESVEAFFRLQIQLAKEVQKAWIKHWEVNRGGASANLVAADLNAEIRPKLISLGDQIIHQIPRALPELHGTERFASNLQEINQAITNPYVSNSRKQQLLDTLMKIRAEDQPEPSLLATILARGVLRVGTTGDYKPFSFIASPTGKLTGVDIDLAEDLAAVMGVKLELVKTSWPMLMSDFAADQFDIGMSGITRTQERRQSAFFSEPYLVGGKTPIARCEAKDQLDSLVKIDRIEIRVIVNPGGTNEKYVRKHIKNAQIILYPDNITIFEQIINKRADVMMTDAIEVEVQEAIHPELCGTMFEKRFDDRSGNVPRELLTHAVKAFLLPQDSYLKEYVDVWLSKVKQSGQLERTLARYTMGQ